MLGCSDRSHTRRNFALAVAFSALASCGWCWEHDGIGMEHVGDIDWWYTYPDGVHAVIENVSGYQKYVSAVDPETTEGDIEVPQFLGGRLVVAIGTNAFLNCMGITSITLPEGLRTICGESFVGCEALESVAFPRSLTEILHGAFEDCPVLQELTFAIDRDLTIEDYAFQNCPEVQTVTAEVGRDLTIGELAFTGVDALTDIALWAGHDMDLQIGAIAGSTELLDFFAEATNNMWVGYHAFSHADEGDYVCEDVTNIVLHATDMVVSNEVCWSEANFSTWPCASLERLAIRARKCTILDRACYECDALENDDFEAEILSVGPEAFEDCTALSHVGLAVTTNLVLKSECFMNTTDLKTIDLPDELRDIGSSAFQKSGLLSISIPASVTNVDDSAFNSCASLTSLVFRAETVRDVVPAWRVRVGASAFESCGELVSIDFSDRIQTLEESSFASCVALPEVELSIATETIGDTAFKNCTSLLRIVFPEHVVTVGTSAFSGCTSLGYAEMRWGMKMLGDTCFSGCSSMTNAVFRERGTETSKVRQLTIGTSAFADLEALATVSFSSNVWKIGVNAFNNCTALEDVMLRQGTYWICEHAFYRCFSVDCVELPRSLAFVDRFAFALAGTDVKFRRVTVIDGEGPGLNLGVGAFYNCSTLRKLVLSSNVTNVGVSAFADCSDLASVKFVKGLRALGISAFSACTSLSTAKLPSGLVDIGETAFKDCTALETIRIPSSVSHIGYWAFHNTAYANASEGDIVCYPADGREIALESAEDFDAKKISLTGFRLLADGLFKDCKSLATVTIPSTITAIPAQCFEGTSIKSVKIPSTVTFVGEGAFKNCRKLKTCDLPAAVTGNLYRSLFENCPKFKSAVVLKTDDDNRYAGDLSLTKVYVSADSASIASNAFASCSNLTEIVIPASVKSIDERAFADCVKLSRVTFLHDRALESLGAECFSGCCSLRDISLPYSLQEVGDRAFAGCVALGPKIVMPEHVESLGAAVFTNCSALARVDFHGAEPTVDEALYAGTRETLCGSQIPLMWSGAAEFETSTWKDRSMLRLIPPPPVTRIRWNANGGTGSLTNYVIVGHALVSLPSDEPEPPAATEEDGYNTISRSFSGWFTKASGGTRVDGETVVSDLTSFYAHYAETVTADGPSGGFPHSDDWPYENVDENPVDTAHASVWCGNMSGGTSVVVQVAKRTRNAYGATNNVVTATVVSDGTSVAYWGVMKNGQPVLLRAVEDEDAPELWLRFTTHGLTGDLGGAPFQGGRPELAEALTASEYARVGLPFSSKVAVANADGLALAFSATGLPPGLSIKKSSGRITGVPTKSGTYTVTVRATASAVSCSAKYQIKISGLHQRVQGEFAGTVLDQDEDGTEQEGVVSLTVGKTGFISGKIMLAGTNWTFSAASYDAVVKEDSAYVYSVRCRAASAADGSNRTLALSVRSDDGCVEGTFDSGADGIVSLRRVAWTADAVADYRGYYVATLDDDEGVAGHGYLCMTVNASGRVQYAGRLPDGTSVSGSGPLVGDELEATLFVYEVPSGYKGGYFYLRVSFLPGLDPMGSDGVWISRYSKATSDYGAGFDRRLSLDGRWYESDEIVKSYYAAMALTDESKDEMRSLEFDAAGEDPLKIGTPGRLSVSFDKVTGVFKGTCRAKFRYGAVSEYQTFTLRGVAVPESDGTGILKGYFLWPRTGQRSSGKTFTYKESHPVELEPK